MSRLSQVQIEQIKLLLEERGELPAEWRWELFPPEKQEYELVYASKRREQDIIADTMAVPLQAVRSFNNGFLSEEGTPVWHNRLIFGDNIQALKSLMNDPEVAGKVKLVYIDPPFSTRQEFRGTQDQKAYQDKVAGAEFIEFIRQRFVLLKELLAPEGSIFVHADYRKVHYLKVVLDELFGEQNFRNEIILPGRASKNLQQQFDEITRLNVRHDTLLWYSANPHIRYPQLWVDKHNKGNPEGHWHHFWSTADRPSMRYELFGHKPTTGQWTWEENRANTAIENYKRYEQEGGGRTLAEYWRDTGSVLDFIRPSPEDGKPQYWRAPSEVRLADTIWTGVPIYNNSTGYPTEKNEALLNQVIQLASRPGDIVLDAFAGSGTTLAVAEKTGRRWIGIDCGKLAIYTIQKRIFNLREKIGNTGKPLKASPYTLYNAGLYDYASLKDLPWEGWRFFALQLFESKDRLHTIGSLHLDGERKGAPVMVFNWKEHREGRVSEETIDDIHAAIGEKIGNKFYIIAPALAFDFYQDFIVRDHVRYYALRIPYSFIQELHKRDFQAVLQARDADEVNDIGEAYGFSFMIPPEVEFETGFEDQTKDLFTYATITTREFVSRSKVKGTEREGRKETLAMLLLDFDNNGEVFQIDQAFYGDELEANGWVARFDPTKVGKQVMAIWVDYHGNEFKAVIPREDFGLPALPNEELLPALIQSGKEGKSQASKK